MSSLRHSIGDAMNRFIGRNPDQELVDAYESISSDNISVGSAIDQNMFVRDMSQELPSVGSVITTTAGPFITSDSITIDADSFDWNNVLNPQVPSFTVGSEELRVKIIAAIGKNNQIGLKGKLPWHFKEDLELFKEKIEDQAIIVGRTTYETMPKSILELCSSIIVITSRDMEDESIELADDIFDAIGIAEEMEIDEVWICGGEQVYNQALESGKVHELHISHIPYEGEADRFFPNFSEQIVGILSGETIHSKGNNKSFRYKVYDLVEEADAPVDALLQNFKQNPLPTFHGSPVVGGPMPTIGGLNFVTTDTSDAHMNEGDVRYRDGRMQMMSGSSIMDISDANSSPAEEAQDIINSVFEDTRYQTLSSDSLTAYMRQVECACREADPSSTIRGEYRIEYQAEPVHILGQYSPVEMSRGAPTSTITFSGAFKRQELTIDTQIG